MTFLTDATDFTVEQIATVLREQLAHTEYRVSDNIRTAAMYSPLAMTTADFVAAASLVGINPGTARNRLNEVRRFQRENGEIA